jgi:hypothetical protein
MLIGNAVFVTLEFRGIKLDGHRIRAADLLHSPGSDTRAIPRPGA